MAEPQQQQPAASGAGEKPSTPLSQKKRVFIIKNAPAESEQSLSPSATPRKPQSTVHRIETEEDVAYRPSGSIVMHRTPEELVRQDSSEVEQDPHTPRELPPPKADVKKKGRFTIKQGDSRKKQVGPTAGLAKGRSGASIRKFEPAATPSEEVPLAIQEEEAGPTQKLGRFKVHNLSRTPPTPLLTSEGAVSEDHFRSVEQELNEEGPVKPKRISTKVFRGETNPEVVLDNATAGAGGGGGGAGGAGGDSTDFGRHPLPPRRTPPPVLAKFQEQDYSSDNLRRLPPKSATLLRAEGLSQFGSVSKAASHEPPPSSQASVLEHTIAQEAYSGSHTALPMYSGAGPEYHSPHWRAPWDAPPAGRRAQLKHDRTVDESKNHGSGMHHPFLFSPKHRHGHGHGGMGGHGHGRHHGHGHHQSLPFRSVHQSLLGHPRPFEHQSTESDSLDEQQQTSWLIARNLEEQAASLRSLVMEQFSLVVRSHENMLYSLLQHCAPPQRAEVALLQQRVAYLEQQRHQPVNGAQTRPS